MTNIPCVVIKLLTLTKEDKDLLDRFLKAAGIQQYSLINIKHYRCPADTNLYITFGSDAALAPTIHNHNYQIIDLPELTSLYDTDQNQEIREKAFNKLCVLYTSIKNNQNIDQIDISNLITEKYLLKLEKYLKNQNLSGFTIWTKDNKTVRIRLNKDDTERADYQIDFCELLAIRLAKETLNFTCSIKENK